MRAIVLAVLLTVVASSLVWAQGPDGKRAASPSGGREYVIDSPRGERPYQPNNERRLERRDDNGLSVGQALGLAAGIYLISRMSSGRDDYGGCSMPPSAPGWYDTGRGYGSGYYSPQPYAPRPYEPGYNPGTGQWAELLCPRCRLKFSAAANIYRCPEDGTPLLWPAPQ